MTKIMVVNFRGAELYGFELGGNVFIALRPIVKAIGLDWSAQYRRVLRDPVLSEGVAMVATPFLRGGPQKGIALRLDLVHGWFFTIDASRASESVREQIIVYQRECYAVLNRHFSGENMEALRQANETDSLHVRMVNEARQVFGIPAAAQLWKQLGLPLVPAMEDGLGQLPLPLEYKKQA